MVKHVILLISDEYEMSHHIKTLKIIDQTETHQFDELNSKFINNKINVRPLHVPILIFSFTKA